MLYAHDRGCTFPGCDAPGYICEVHHVDEWAGGGLTNVDKLTFTCQPHHRLLDKGWRTAKLANGQTHWIPPPQLPLSGGVNSYHHPERYLADDDTGDAAAARTLQHALYRQQSVQTDETNHNDDAAQRLRR